MNFPHDFNIKQELQSNLMNLSYDKLDDIKKIILSSIFWNSKNDYYLQNLSFNILNTVIYRSTSIQLYCQLIFDLINSDQQIGDKFLTFLIEFLFHSISQEIIYPHRCSHFSFLYFLYKQGIVDINIIISQFRDRIENALSEKEMIIFSFFSQDIKIENKELYDLVKLYFAMFTENIPLYLNEFKMLINSKIDFSIDIHIFQSNSLRNCIKNDDVNNLKKIASNPEFNINQELSPSIYEPSLILQNYPPILHAAAFYQSIKCFNFLLMSGSDPNLTDRSHRPLSNFAVAGGSIEIIRIIEQRQLSFEGTLQISTLFNRNDIFSWLYESHFQNISLSTYSTGKRTVLNEASISNNFFVLKTCIKHKVKINKPNARKSTALHLAAAYNNYDIIDILLGLNHPKLDPNIINISGLTPLMIAIQRENVESVNVFLSYFSKNISLNAIHINIEKKSEDNENSYAIHLAAKTGNVKIFKSLLEKIKNVNVKQKYGYTALHIAVSMHHTQIVNELLNDQRVDLNAQDDGGWTPLHLASQFGFCDIVKLFVICVPRVDLKIRTFDGKTAFDLASTEKRTDIIELLK